MDVRSTLILLRITKLFRYWLGSIDPKFVEVCAQFLILLPNVNPHFFGYINDLLSGFKSDFSGNPAGSQASLNNNNGPLK